MWPQPTWSKWRWMWSWWFSSVLCGRWSRGSRRSWTPWSWCVFGVWLRELVVLRRVGRELVRGRRRRMLADAWRFERCSCLCGEGSLWLGRGDRAPGVAWQGAVGRRSLAASRSRPRSRHPRRTPRSARSPKAVGDCESDRPDGRPVPAVDQAVHPLRKPRTARAPGRPRPCARRARRRGCARRRTEAGICAVGRSVPRAVWVLSDPSTRKSRRRP